MFVLKGGGIAIARLSFRILVGAWLLIAMVLVNSYSGTVISYLTVPKMKQPINNLEDLASSEDVGLILLADTVIEQQIRVRLGHFFIIHNSVMRRCVKTLCHLPKDAKSGALKVIGDQVRSNPDRIASSVPKVYGRLESGNFAFPFVSFHRKYMEICTQLKEL
jgi:ionotropic glutamate receptor